jgi:hypothetical protein
MDHAMLPAETIITCLTDISSPATYTIRAVALYNHTFYKYDEMFDHDYFQCNTHETPPPDNSRPCIIVLGDAHGTCIALKIPPGPWRGFLAENNTIGGPKSKHTYPITHLEALPDDSPRPIGTTGWLLTPVSGKKPRVTKIPNFHYKPQYCLTIADLRSSAGPVNALLNLNSVKVHEAVHVADTFTICKSLVHFAHFPLTTSTLHCPVFPQISRMCSLLLMESTLKSEAT